MPNTSYSVVSKNKIKSFNKTIFVDSDKSISIRAFLIGSICQGISEIKNILESDDVFSTIECLKKLGVKIKKIGKKNYSVYGKGLGSLYAKKNTILNCGNSGTLARLLVGILSTTPFIDLKITGDMSLRKRNMSSLIDLMNKFGVSFEKNRKFMPLKMLSSSMPLGISYNSGVSAQLKSAVILAGLNSYGFTLIRERKDFQSRNHTENILLKNSRAIQVKKDKIKIFGKSPLNPLKLFVPGDPSSAAFFCALTIFTKNSKLKIKNVCLNSRRTGFYNILKKHGAKIKFKNVKRKNNEVVGDIIVKNSNLKPLKTSSKYYPSTTDEYVILSVCAAMTPGVSVFNGIGDLSNKESSRAQEMKNILNQVGIKCKVTKDVMKVYGKRKILNERKKIIQVKKLNDHRICMAVICLSLATGIKCNIKNFETVETSSPSFLKIIKSVGGKFEIKKN
tara:strand:+ start:1935 stop:3281 length:1347 start_codon:yes stop_codon:yes gene_type:complete